METKGGSDLGGDAIFEARDGVGEVIRHALTRAAVSIRNFPVHSGSPRTRRIEPSVSVIDLLRDVELAVVRADCIEVSPPEGDIELARERPMQGDDHPGDE